MTTYFDADRKTLKRWAIEHGVISALNVASPPICHRLFDCGELGLLRVWWSGMRWETGWADKEDILCVADMPPIVAEEAKHVYREWKRQRAWVKRHEE